MSIVRSSVGVYDQTFGAPKGEAAMPAVFSAAIRPDLVNFIHYNLARNTRQAHGVMSGAGYQTSAESWGTGRAVSRIPRVPGGGTHRSGQAAFGNMCRGGGMFAPLKTWRRWHRRCNLTQKRHAIASAVAATGYPGLVMGRGHKVDDVPELPLVVSDNAEEMKRTKQAVALFEKAGLAEELRVSKESRKIRAGRGKSRNRRYITRRGPLVVYANDKGIARAVRNLPGVESCHVERLSLKKLAPGGVLGRMVVWSQSAFEKLDEIYQNKSKYSLNRPFMANPDITRVLNSAEVQAVLKH